MPKLSYYVYSFDLDTIYKSIITNDENTEEREINVITTDSEEGKRHNLSMPNIPNNIVGMRIRGQFSSQCFS